MKIYAVYHGNDYECGGISGTLFRLKTDAIMEGHAIAARYNGMWSDYQLLDCGDEWRDGYDYIKVMEYDLI